MKGKIEGCASKQGAIVTVDDGAEETACVADGEERIWRTFPEYEVPDLDREQLVIRARFSGRRLNIRVACALGSRASSHG